MIRSLQTSMLTMTMCGVMLAAAQPALALDDAHRAKGEQVVAKAIEYLRQNQSPDGSWTPKPGPAVTGLVLSGMLRSPDIDRADPTIMKALSYILPRQKPDGGIYDTYAKNYNTAISLMALAQLEKPDDQIKDSIKKAQQFLKDLQWDTTKTDPTGTKVAASHPYFGGAGYNDSKHGRPDLSNTSIMLAALYDSGVDSNDVVFQRAVVFVERLQGIEENKMFGDRIVQNGGIIYATSHNKDNIGVPESKANPDIVERIRNGGELEESEKLRPYGSISYAGYMSYLYAKLAPNDYRVRAVRDYLRENYTVEENPAMGQKSYYYYVMMFGRAWKAAGDEQVTLPGGEKRDWANDLIAELAERQSEDGSWTNAAHDWMEGDPNLCTAYALVALQCALGR